MPIGDVGQLHHAYLAYTAVATRAGGKLWGSLHNRCQCHDMNRGYPNATIREKSLCLISTAKRRTFGQRQSSYLQNRTGLEAHEKAYLEKSGCFCRSTSLFDSCTIQAAIIPSPRASYQFYRWRDGTSKQKRCFSHSSSLC